MKKGAAPTPPQNPQLLTLINTQKQALLPYKTRVLERFIGILLEHYAGKLPLWLSPLQAVVLPITSEFDNYAKKIFEQFVKAGINTEVDLKNQKINYKIREYSLSKVPLLIICGKKELKNKSVTIRKLGSQKQDTLTLIQAIKKISQKNKFPIN